jgi:colanic acid/amylovoran biosynthesis glycosyltransferase
MFRKIKIGFVLNGPVRYSETFLLEEFKHFQKEGFEIIVFQGYEPSSPKNGYATFTSLPIKIHGWAEIIQILVTFTRLLSKGLLSLFKFIIFEFKSSTPPLRILKRIWFNAHILPCQVDRLHFCFADVAIQKELTAKSIGAIMSVSLRGSDILIYPIKRKNSYERLWKNVDQIHAVSNWIYEEAIKIGLKTKTQYSIIHDNINPDLFIFNDRDIHNPLKILSVGRLEKVKDHNFALEVIKKLIEQSINVEYKIVGDGGLKSSLLLKIKELGIEDHVKLLGKKNHSEICKLMNQSDLFLHTSRSEGLGVAVLEAQASGLLTVSLDAGGSRESIEEGLSGWIVKERSVLAVAKKIIEIIKLPSDDRINVKRYARDRIIRKFNITKSINEWNKFLH